MKKNFNFLLTLCLSTAFTTTIFGSDFNMSFMYGGSSHQYKNYLETSQNNLDFVSPDYFNLSSIGKLSINENFDENFINTAHSNGIKVVPYLTTNKDKIVVSEALKNGSILAVDLTREIKDKNLDGVTIDFSNLTNENVGDFTNFLKTVKTNLSDKILNVSISPDLNSYNNTNINLYDYKQIGEIADNVIIMNFDESAVQNKPGPISNNKYLSDTIEKLVKDIPSEKIVLGVSFHGRYWNTDEDSVAKNITSSDINNLLQNYKSTKQYDNETKHYKANLTISENDIIPKIWGGESLLVGNYEIWYEDASSLDIKKQLVNKYHLKGIATWSLGEDDVQIWNKFKDEDFTEVNNNLNDNLPKLDVVYDFSALGKDEQASNASDDINSLIADTTKRTWTTERNPDTGTNKDTIIIETIEDEVTEDQNIDQPIDQNINFDENNMPSNDYNTNYAPNTNNSNNITNEKNTIDPNDNINTRRNDSQLSYDPMYNVDYLPENTTVPQNSNNVNPNEPAINVPSSIVDPDTNQKGTTEISINEKTTSENNSINQETAETFSYDENNKNNLMQDNKNNIPETILFDDDDEEEKEKEKEEEEEILDTTNNQNVFDQKNSSSNINSNKIEDNTELKIAKQTVFNNTSYKENDFLNGEYVRRDKAISVLMDKIDVDFTADFNNMPFKNLENNEYANDILKALKFNYITDEGNFGPDIYITKKELVNIIDKMYDLSNNVNFNKTPFSDLNKQLDSDSYYIINKLYDHGIIKGDSNNKFYPDENLKREDFVQILYNLKDFKLKSIGGYTASMNISFDRVFVSK